MPLPMTSTRFPVRSYPSRHARPALLLAAGAVAATASFASATTRSSFTSVNAINGIVLTHPSPLQYSVALNNGATFTLNGTSYSISDVIGFYGLSDGNDISPITSVMAMGNFSNDSSNSGPGGILGWKSNPNRGIIAGGSQVFTFSTGTNIAQFSGFGFHVRLSTGLFPGTSGNTGNITGPIGGFTVIPGPAAASVLGLGGIIALRRRRPAAH